jgi:hypothetical protein
MDRAGGQRTGEVARGQVDRPVPDGQQAVAGLDRLLYERLACLAVVEAEVVRERLVDHCLGRGRYRYRPLGLLGQRHDLACGAEPVGVRVHQYRR